MESYELVEIEKIKNNSYIYYYGNFIKEYLDWIDAYYSKDKNKFYVYMHLINRKIKKYFLKNKYKYFFVKNQIDDDIHIIDKEYVLLNINVFYEDFNERFCKFVKYHLIKEKLYEEL